VKTVCKKLFKDRSSSTLSDRNSTTRHQNVIKSSFYSFYGLLFHGKPKIRVEAQQLSAHEQNIKKTAD
jgi:hypothetical protein